MSLLSDRWFSWDYPTEADIGLNTSTGLVQEVKRFMVEYGPSVQMPSPPPKPILTTSISNMPKEIRENPRLAQALPTVIIKNFMQIKKPPMAWYVPSSHPHWMIYSTKLPSQKLSWTTISQPLRIPGESILQTNRCMAKAKSLSCIQDKDHNIQTCFVILSCIFLMCGPASNILILSSKTGYPNQ